MAIIKYYRKIICYGVHVIVLSLDFQYRSSLIHPKDNSFTGQQLLLFFNSLRQGCPVRHDKTSETILGCP